MGGGGGGEFIIPLNNLTGRRSAARAAQGCSVSVSFDAHHTKKGSGCSGTTGRSAERLPFLVAVPSWDITAGHPMLASFVSGDFLLHIPCWLHLYLGTFSYTSHAGFICIWGLSLTHPMLASFVSGDFLLHIPCWLHLYLGTFSYTSHAGFICIWGLSLTHPMLASFVSGDFPLHIPCWLHFDLGSFSRHPVPPLILSGNFPGAYTSHAGFIFIGGVSLTHPVLVLFLCTEFLLHIPCCLHFCTRSLSDTSRAAFIFMRGVSLTHPKLPSFICGEFLLHIPYRLLFMWGVSLTHPVLTFFRVRSFFPLQSTLKTRPLKKELGGSWPRRKVWKSHSQTREGSPRTTWTEQNETK